MKRWFLLVFLVALFPLLTGCAAMLERSYSAEAIHVATAPSLADEPLMAEDYDALVAGMLSLVEQHLETGVIHLLDADENVEQAMQTARREVMRSDPLGAYIVDDITYKSTRVIPYYEIAVSFFYRVSEEDVERIVTVVGPAAIRSEIGSALEQFSGSLALYTLYFSDSLADQLDALVLDAYFSQPSHALGLGSYDIAFYPEEGARRIIELSFDYPASAAMLGLRQREALRAAEALLAEAPGNNPLARAGMLASGLAVSTRYAPAQEDAPQLASIWDTLVGGEGCDMSFALAYQLLCDQAGLDCRIVSGILQGQPRYWNIITIDGVSAHVDIAAHDEEGQIHYFDDEAFSHLEYFWAADEYPVCTGFN